MKVAWGIGGEEGERSMQIQRLHARALRSPASPVNIPAGQTVHSVRLLCCCAVKVLREALARPGGHGWHISLPLIWIEQNSPAAQPWSHASATGVGCGVGLSVGEADGEGVGAGEGDGIGDGEGAGVGDGEGATVGDAVGRGVGRRVGLAVGVAVGADVVFGVGCGVGCDVGLVVGLGVGAGG